MRPAGPAPMIATLMGDIKLKLVLDLLRVVSNKTSN